MLRISWMGQTRAHWVNFYSRIAYNRKLFKLVVGPISPEKPNEPLQHTLLSRGFIIITVTEAAVLWSQTN